MVKSGANIGEKMIKKRDIRIWHNDLSLTNEVAFLQEREDGWYVVKPIKFDYVKYIEGESIQPTMTLSDRELTIFAEALSRNGIQTDSDHKIKGKLDATLYHLEDLRSLLKLN